jgi:hypothetical protein
MRFFTLHLFPAACAVDKPFTEMSSGSYIAHPEKLLVASPCRPF